MRLASLLSALLVFSAAGFAQTATGTITGTICRSSGSRCSERAVGVGQHANRRDGAGGVFNHRKLYVFHNSQSEPMSYE